jgi:hypothetical protein
MINDSAWPSGFTHGADPLSGLEVHNFNRFVLLGRNKQPLSPNVDCHMVQSAINTC